MAIATLNGIATPIPMSVILYVAAALKHERRNSHLCTYIYQAINKYAQVYSSAWIRHFRFCSSKRKKGIQLDSRYTIHCIHQETLTWEQQRFVYGGWKKTSEPTFYTLKFVLFLFVHRRSGPTRSSSVYSAILLPVQTHQKSCSLLSLSLSLLNSLLLFCRFSFSFTKL